MLKKKLSTPLVKYNDFGYMTGWGLFVIVKNLPKLFFVTKKRR